MNSSCVPNESERSVTSSTHLVLRCRRKVLVNTDPLKRCYNGCYFSVEYQWSAWEVFDSQVPVEKAESTLKFWRELNDYAVLSRGEGARIEWELVPATELETSP